jgi:hypothetical protein
MYRLPKVSPNVLVQYKQWTIPKGVNFPDRKPCQQLIRFVGISGHVCLSYAYRRFCVWGPLYSYQDDGLSQILYWIGLRAFLPGLVEMLG